MIPTNDPVTDLLVRWEELRQQGQNVSAEALCSDDPDLLPAVRERIAALESMGRLLQTDGSAAGGTAARASSRPDGFERLKPGAEPVRGYRLVERVGKGGFGEVWKARGPSGFNVALKFVPYSGAGGDAEIRALKIIKELRHPNLVSVFGAWGTKSLIVIAMELADRSLWDRLQEARAAGEPGIPRDELLEYMQQAARAIDYLNAPQHRLGEKEVASVQHRDIKPQNLLLFGGDVKVADFGLARLVHDGATSHTGNLTVLYAAPEFFEGRTTQWSDQYSLAVTYCMLLGGRPPFTGEPAQIMAGHLHRFPDLTMVPEKERPAITRALAKLPQHRWPTCRAFVDALASDGPHKPPGPAALLLRLAWGGIAALLGVLVLVANDSVRSYPKIGPGPPPLVGEIRRLVGHSGRVVEVAFSPSGRTAVSGGMDNTVRLWDVETGKEIHRLDGHTGFVTCVCFTPDGLHVVSGSMDKTLRLWDVATGKEVRRFAHNHPVSYYMRVTSDGKRILASSDDNYVHVWDLESGKELRYFGFRETANVIISIVAYSTDGRRALALEGDCTVRLCDVDKGRMVRDLDRQSSGATFSADGRFTIAYGLDNFLRLYEVESGRLVRRFMPGPSVVHAASFSPDGRRVLASYDDRDDAGLWDVQSGSEILRLAGNPVGIGRIVFSPDGRHAISAGNDGTVRLWGLPD